ncbi:hypothetical protein IIW_04914, partial [Bacillus cereus VD136]
MAERGIIVAHTTIMRWVHQYGPELDKRIRRQVLLQSWKKYREVYRLEIGFKQSLLIAVVLCT